MLAFLPPAPVGWLEFDGRMCDREPDRDGTDPAPRGGGQGETRAGRRDTNSSQENR